MSQSYLLRLVPHPLRRLLKRSIRRAGYDVVAHDPHGSLGAHLRTVLDALRVNCVLDVGAHQGEYVALLRAAGYRGHVVSLEPVRASFEALCAAHGADPQWRGLRLALGDTDGTAPIRVTGASNLSSFLALSQGAVERFGDASRVTHEEPVEVRRLDGLLDDLVARVPEPRLFLKTDTQGSDLNVVAGAGSSLSRFLGLQTELAVRALYEGMVTLPQALDRLSGLGFCLTGMYPVCRDKDGLRMMEYDCVFIRRP